MGEKKYIFRIDNSKAAEKFMRNFSTSDKEEITSSDFKVTCVNCLYYKEIEFAENYKDYNSLPHALALLTPNYDIYFTIAKSNKCGDEVVHLSDKDGNTIDNVKYSNNWITNIIKDFKDLYDAVSNCDILLLENLTDTYIQNIIEYLTGNQLQALAEH